VLKISETTGTAMYVKNRAMYLTGRDKKLIGFLTVLLVMLSLVCWYLFHEIYAVLLIAVCASMTIALQIEIYRRIAIYLEGLQRFSERQLEAQSLNYKEIESLVQVISLLRLSAPLPPMRDWAILPDFAALIIGLVREKRPAMVLELGSGVSTLVAAYSLKAIGEGRIVSLEHDKDFARTTEENVRKHDLTDVVRVICSPLKEVVIGSRTHQWYGTDPLEGLEGVGILIVDGPPGNLQEMARYPALPILWKRLRDDVVIIVDDAARSDEKKMIQIWLREYPELHIEYAETAKGAVVLRRSKSASAFGISPVEGVANKGAKQSCESGLSSRSADTSAKL
jgi:hypothetical protein